MTASATKNPVWLSLRNELKTETLRLLKAHNIEGWTVSFEDVVTRSGRCDYLTKTISYSIPYMLAHAEDRKVRMNTVYHETAHAIVGAGQQHNTIWKRKFVSLGGDGKRSSIAPAGIMTHDNYLWLGECPSCKSKSGKKSAPRTLWVCTACSESTPKAERLLVWFKNGVKINEANVSANYAKAHRSFKEKIERGYTFD